MKVRSIAILTAACGLTGCAFNGAMTPNPSSQPGAHARVLPRTAVVLCHWNGAICEPPLTASQGHFSGSVDAYGNVSFSDPDGLPPR